MLLWRLTYSRYRSYTRRNQQRRLITDGRSFDYGARTSIREEATGSAFNRYFLELDADMYVKVVQERLLQRILGFLKDHDIDTSGFIQQQINITNSQIDIKDSSIGSGSAIGQHAMGGNVQHTSPPTK
jgi:hypothetical protein